MTPLSRRLAGHAVAAQARVAEAVGRGLDALGGAQGSRDARGGRLDPAHVHRVIVIRPDEIGDVVMTTPFLRELRAHFPSAHVTLVVKREVVNLVERCPYVDDVRAFAAAPPRRLRPLLLPLRALRLARAELRPIGADLVILPRWDGDQAYATFAARWSGARWRLGHSERVSPYKRLVNRGFDRLLTTTVDDPAPKHEVERSLDLLRALGRRVADTSLELWTDAADDAFAEAFLAGRGVAPGDALVALNPTPGHSRLKQWPAAHFAALAARLAAGGAKLLVVGGAGDAPLAATIRDAARDAVLDATGRATLRQTVALLRRCRLCVSGDTGPMHMAAAAGVPVVALFGSTDPARYAPWGPRHRVLTLDLPCSPARRAGKGDRCNVCELGEPRCMIDLSAAAVHAAAESVLGPRAPG